MLNLLLIVYALSLKLVKREMMPGQNEYTLYGVVDRTKHTSLHCVIVYNFTGIPAFLPESLFVYLSKAGLVKYTFF